MANNNKALQAANRAKKDEFYTQIEDISAELNHYKNHFEGQTVFCNCDDPYESNFFKFFALKFNALKLKKLICTCWCGSTIAQSEFVFDEVSVKATAHVPKKKAFKIELTEVKDMNNDGAENLEDVKLILKEHPLTELKGDANYAAGDFRSQECIELLKESDIVVTNPPFSLFREYVAQLIKHKKKFLIIGNQNAITYKEIFPLIKGNKLWLGFGFRGGAAHFHSCYEDVARAGDHREGMIRVSGVMWFTNLDHKKRHEPLDLYKHYSPEEYPKYDNYDAIEVGETKNIPLDYDGMIGVPLTFMHKYCPEQFEILGMCENEDLYGLKTRRYTSEECKQAYFERFRKKGVYDLNASGVLIKNGTYEKVYQRILIRLKQK